MTSQEVIIHMLDNQNLILNNCLDEKKEIVETNKMLRIIRRAQILIVLKYVLTVSIFMLMVFGVIHFIRNSSDRIYTLSSNIIIVSSVILSFAVIGLTFIFYKIAGTILMHLLIKYDKAIKEMTDRALLYGNNLGLYTDINDSKMAIIAIGHHHVRVLLREYNGAKRFNVPVQLFLEKGNRDEITFYNDHIELVLTDALYNEIERLNEDIQVNENENHHYIKLGDMENGFLNNMADVFLGYDDEEDSKFEDDDEF